MNQELLTKKDISLILHMSPISAKKLLERNGVQPINVGNGKVPRLRWLSFEVMTFLDTLAERRSVKQPDTRLRRRHGKDSQSVFSMPINDIMAIIQ